MSDQKTLKEFFDLPIGEFWASKTLPGSVTTGIVNSPVGPQDPNVKTASDVVPSVPKEIPWIDFVTASMLASLGSNEARRKYFDIDDETLSKMLLTNPDQRLPIKKG